jgi:hypothetical protein
MPMNVAEDSIELKIELLESRPPTSSSYPFPSLGKSGQSELRQFRTLVLENPFLRATVVPDLGGRIIRLQDLRSNTDVWHFSPELSLENSGLRGVRSSSGLQLVTNWEDRLNALGPVADMPDLGEEDDPTGVWLSELCGNGLSINWRVSLLPDAPILELEARVFNRSLQSVPYNGGIAMPSGDWACIDDHWAWRGPHGCMVLELERMFYAEAGRLHRFNRLRHLAPRQLDAWTLHLIPSAVGAGLRGANASVHVGWDESELKIQGMQDVPDAKVVVRTSANETMELPMDISRDSFEVVSITSVPGGIAELVILDRDRVERIRATDSKSCIPSRAQDDEAPISLSIDASEDALLEAKFDPYHRHLAHVLTGYRFLGQRDYSAASRAFEQALLFNAEDHLTWWAKAAADRLAGTEDEERPELLNAHFLAPLEPVLRAEGFLSTKVQSRARSSVLDTLQATPGAFVEVACQLLEANLYEDAARWLAESLLHVDLPILRYLLADLYLQLGRMDVEAAEQVQLAVTLEPQPPYPWRMVELDALRRVAARFPSDGSLSRFASLADSAAQHEST